MVDIIPQLSKKIKKDKLPQDYGICQLSVMPIRQKPADTSEMVSQLLFGELVHIVSRKNKSWVKIKCDYDDYIGWVDPKQLMLLTETEFIKCKENVGVVLDISSSLTNASKSFPILIGSSLPQFDGISFKLPTEKFLYNGQAIMTDDRQPSVELLIKIAMKYINAPYLWGGRSPFGIDCSGFTQVVFKLMGIKIPRDASEQAGFGTIVDFVELSKEGDLAFFVNKEEKIHHVGIMYGEGQIIHASGQVRIDTLDHEGIYNQDTKKYTHRLKFIRRVI